MRIKSLALALVLALFVALPFAAPVLAVPGMTPSQGTVGSSVTVSGLSAGMSYAIKWDGNEHKSGTVPSEGIVNFTVPDSSGGGHTVLAESPTGTAVLSVTFTVTPSITVAPNTGTVGTAVEVKGTGFGVAETNIRATYGGSNVGGVITANDSGSWSTSFSVPASTKGSHIIDAYGSNTEATSVPDRTFTVDPRISIDPSSGAVGSSVKVSGTGFAGSESGIKVIFGGKEVKTGLTAGDNGSWNVSFSIPPSVKGSHVIDAYGGSTNSGDVPDVTFTVSPGVTISLTSGYVEDEVKVSGNGFVSQESGIKVTFDGDVVASDIRADDDGYWTATIVIPESVNGTHAVDAYGNTTTATDVAGANFMVSPSMVLSPKKGNVGDSVMVRVTGLSGKKDVIVTYGGLEVISGYTTDSKGSFAASFNAPKGKSGDIKVTVADAANVTISATFTMESTPPPAPQIAAPKDGATIGFVGDVKVTFDWTDIPDPSGVHYELEISEQSTFSNFLVRHTELQQSEYTLTEAEALPYGKYYWRVRAVDGAGNASEWTHPAVVKAGYTTVKTLVIAGIALVAFIILLSVLLSKVPKSVRRRRIDRWTSTGPM